MLKLITSDAQGQTLWLGLDRENLNRLPRNEPIGVDMDELGNPENLIRIFIIGGETLDDLMDDLRSLGIPLPKDLPE